MGRTGFEPVKALPTDLQSVPFNRSGTDPYLLIFSWGKRDLNPHDFKKSTDFKSVASTYSATSPLHMIYCIIKVNICQKLATTN